MERLNGLFKQLDEFKIKTSHYIIGAASLVVAISWNDSVKLGIDQTFPQPKNQLQAKFIYSTIITILLMVLIYFMPDTKKELPPDIKNAIEEKKKNKELQEQIEKLKNEKNDLQDRLKGVNQYINYTF